jgi:N-methylhydantoinase B/acetone carboxylase alpha subunit
MAKLKKKIGWNGKSAREMLEESEELFKKTGHYYGLEKLKLKEEDPVRYEKMFIRLRGGLVSARETSKNISASPIVKEEGELCYGLYTPEGDSIVVSTGIMVHIHTMSDAIKYMVRNNYEQAPGIAPGDMFINTDVQVGNVHTSDVQTLVPIFWEGELVGWAAGVTQELDIGAITSGAAPVGPTNTFEDGLSFPCLKMGENDTIRPDYQAFCERSVRTPMYWKLDERTRVAGCHLIRRAVHCLIEQEGIDTYKQFIREVIEDGRRTFVNRIKELLVPGTYRHPSFIDSCWAAEQRLSVLGRKDTIMHAPLELKIGQDGSFNLNFEGASAWGWHSFNCSPTAMQGGMWVLLTQTIMPNDKVNDGAYLATNIKLPIGSWANPQNPIVAFGHAWFYLMPAFMGLFSVLSRGFQSRGFVEEVDCGYGFPGNGFNGWGIDNYGKTFAFTTFEFSCVGCGAGMIKDGLDHAAAMWNPEGDMGDVESWEMLEPFLYLGRRIKPNSAGPGKFRGGSGFESLRMCWKVSYCEAQFVGEGKVFCSGGLFGGYPNASGYRHIFRDTNVLETAKREQIYPIREVSPDVSEFTPFVKKGKEILDKHCVTLPEEFKLGDIFLSPQRGAPGVGDPLERDPYMVVKDLNTGYVTEPYAKRVYGVIARKDNDGKWNVDEEATTHQREAIKQQRSKCSVPVSEWLKKTREKVLNKDIISPLKNMYAQSMNLSESWAKEYRRFWDLPENFTYEGG